MKFPQWLKVYGDQTMRGHCALESAELITFFQRIRLIHPDTYGLIALHARNEGKRHHAQTKRHKLEGMTAGAPDIIIPGRITFVCELKRRDHTTCGWQPAQLTYLKAAQDAGAFVCVALGCDAAWEAFTEWQRLN